MPKVEIEEAELAELKRTHGFAAAALSNPKTRTQLLEIQKALNPGAVIPELDATQRVMSSFNELSKKLDDMNTKLAETAAAEEKRRLDAAVAERIVTGQRKLAAAGYVKEGIDKIETMMTERGIADYDAGLALFERLNPPAPPADHSRSQRFGSMSDVNVDEEDYKQLWESKGDNEAWLNGAVDRAIKSVRNN